MRRFLNLLPGRRRRMEQSLDREIRYHLDRRIDDLTKSGLAGTEARRQALIEFGGPTQVQEEVRDAWFWRWLQDIGRDARYALRVLLASPGFTATAILSLALGMGANTAIFSILHALVLRSLPVSDPQRLVVVTRNQIGSSPYPLLVHLRDHSQALEGVLAFRTAPMRISQGGETERITGALVSGTYFGVLGVRPSIGAAITDEDDRILGSGGSRGPRRGPQPQFLVTPIRGASIGSRHTPSSERTSLHRRRRGAAGIRRHRSRRAGGCICADDDAGGAPARLGGGAVVASQSMASHFRAPETRSGCAASGSRTYNPAPPV